MNSELIYFRLCNSTKAFCHENAKGRYKEVNSVISKIRYGSGIPDLFLFTHLYFSKSIVFQVEQQIPWEE